MAQELKPFKLGSVELGEYWAYDSDDVDAVLAEKDAFIKTLGEGQAELACEIERLKTKLEDVQASTNAEIRRLKRALWITRAGEAAKEVNYLTCENESSYAIVDFNVHHETFQKRERKLKRKRCLAMAQEWRNYAAFCGMQSSCHNHRGFGKTAEKWNWKECHAWKCVKRWLELSEVIAEKFKEAK